MIGILYYNILMFWANCCELNLMKIHTTYGFLPLGTKEFDNTFVGL